MFQAHIFALTLHAPRYLWWENHFLVVPTVDHYIKFCCRETKNSVHGHCVVNREYFARLFYTFGLGVTRNHIDWRLETVGARFLYLNMSKGISCLIPTIYSFNSLFTIREV